MFSIAGQTAGTNWLKPMGTWTLKCKRVSLNETLKFPIWGLNIYVDFDLKIQKQIRIWGN